MKKLLRAFDGTETIRHLLACFEDSCSHPEFESRPRLGLQVGHNYWNRDRSAL
jgi:hypothetical protein